MHGQRSKVCGLLLASFALLAFAGCSNYKEDAADMRRKWRAGDYAAAAVSAEKNISRDPVEKVGGSDLVWQLEYAAILKDDNKTLEALDAFKTAYDQIEVYDSREEISLTDEMAAMATNMNALPYRGRNCDRVMLHTYAAMLHFEKGDKNAADISLNRARLAAEAAAAENDREIAKQTEKAESQNVVPARTKRDRDARRKTRRNTSGNTRRRNNQAISGVADVLNGEACRQAIAEDKEKQRAVFNMSAAELENYLRLVYENPYQQWLNGVNMLYNGEAENAKRRFKALSQLYPENRYIAEDLKIAEGEKTAKNHTVYVVFESGMGATLGERELILPSVPVKAPDTGRVFLVSFAIAWPTFKPSKMPKYWENACLVNGSIDCRAEEVCDMDAVLLADFNSTFQTILAKTIAGGLAKTVFAAAANYAASRELGNAGGTAVNLITTAVNVKSAAADVRAWQTLPRNFSIFRMDSDVPVKSLSVRVANLKPQDVPVKNPDAKVNIIFVKTVTDGGPMKITGGVIAE